MRELQSLPPLDILDRGTGGNTKTRCRALQESNPGPPLEML
jgi:hypothetical protein